MFDSRKNIAIPGSATTRIFSVSGPFRVRWINFSIDTAKVDIEILIDGIKTAIDIDLAISESIFQQDGFPIRIIREGVNHVLYVNSRIDGDSSFAIDVVNKRKAAAEIGLFYIDFDSKEAPE